MALIISGWNLSWGEGTTTVQGAWYKIISGWNLSWGEGVPVVAVQDTRDYIRLESELG